MVGGTQILIDITDLMDIIPGMTIGAIMDTDITIPMIGDIIIILITAMAMVVEDIIILPATFKKEILQNDPVV